MSDTTIAATPDVESVPRAASSSNLRQGVLLINLGTPDAPTPAAVKYCKTGQPKPPAPITNTLALEILF